MADEVRRLHLGCGNNYMKDWINIDRDKTVDADIHRDLEKGLPFEDNAIDEVYSKFLIEHIKDDVFLMNEIYRVCKDGATVTLDFPSSDGIGAFDWDHKSFWNERKIHYLQKSNRTTYMGLDCDMIIDKIGTREEGEIPTPVMRAILKVVK